MSRFLESYVSRGNTEQSELLLLVDLAIQYPEIAAALGGQEGNGNGTPHVPPMQLSIKIRDGALKWSLYSDESAWMFFGTIKDLKSPLEAIERDLATKTHDTVAKHPKSSSNNRR